MSIRRLSTQADRNSEVLSVSFNQDNSCICLGTRSFGIVVYCCNRHSCIHVHDVGGSISLAQMLYRTSLLAFVGSGEQPSLTPRKLTVINTGDGSKIQDMNYTSSVLAVHINHQRLVAVLHTRAYVYELHTLKHLRTIDTPPNPLGTSCLSPGPEGGSLLALPCCAATGMLRVYNLLERGGDVLAEVAAHKTQLAVMSWSPSAHMLASASTKGTVIRVHRLPQGTKAFSFRRGTYPATIHDLAFSPDGIEPPLLCASSSHGTMHVFRLEDPSCTTLACGRSSRSPAAVAAANAANGLLSAVMQVSPMPDAVEPARSIANLKLPPPCHDSPATCRFVPGPAKQQLAASPEVTVLAASLTGSEYEYRLKEMQSQEGPKCFLVAQRSMLPVRI